MPQAGGHSPQSRYCTAWPPHHSPRHGRMRETGPGERTWGKQCIQSGTEL